MARGRNPGENLKPLSEEIDETKLEEKRELIEKERAELEKRAKLLAEQTQLEAEERQLGLMKRKIDELMQARKRAAEAPSVLNPESIGERSVATQMKKVLEMLEKEEAERKKAEEMMKQKEEEEKRKQELQEEEERKNKESEEKEKQEPARKAGNPEGLDKVLAWIAKQEEEKKRDEEMKDKIKGLQSQIEHMAKGDNRQVCPTTGVNMWANLEAIQGDGATGINLAAKAQTAMLAATAEKRRRLDGEESEGESIHSGSSHLSKHKKPKKSGLAIRSTHKTVVEVEWAHHWLGKEFEANPVPFNQLKLGHYIMGEANILLGCVKPEEFKGRLKLMKKLGYWQIKFDWPSARNVYAAILRGIEVGRESWDFDLRDYEDMLIPATMGTQHGMGGGSRDRQRKGRDAYFCAGYQKGECALEPPHPASVGNDGIERMVLHVCSSCLLKDGRKLSHPNGAPACPRSRTT